MGEQTAKAPGLNRAKTYQLVPVSYTHLAGTAGRWCILLFCYLHHPLPEDVL